MLKIIGDNLPLSEVQGLKEGRVDKVIAKITDPEIVKSLEKIEEDSKSGKMQSAMLATEITTMIQKQQEDNAKAIAELTTMISMSMSGGMK